MCILPEFLKEQVLVVRETKDKENGRGRYDCQISSYLDPMEEACRSFKGTAAKFVATPLADK